MTPKGEWEEGTYRRLDMVSYKGSSYVSMADGNTAESSDVTKWMLVAGFKEIKGHSPELRGGTWWEWDDERGEYTDTGVPASLAYVLTREKVEAVLTGDVQTHGHATQLAEAMSGLVKVEEGKGLSSNDYTDKEKAKLGKLNTVPMLDHEPGEADLSFSDVDGEHTFQTGDSACVADAGSGTGYAFFRLHDVKEGKAVWDKEGSAAESPAKPCHSRSKATRATATPRWTAWKSTSNTAWATTRHFRGMASPCPPRYRQT